MNFNEIDGILESVPARGAGGFSAVRLTALTRIALAMFGYCSVSPDRSDGMTGLKYCLYLQNRLPEDFQAALTDGRIAPEKRVAAAREYFRVRYESGAVWNTDDCRLVRSEAAIRELLAGRVSADLEAEERCGLLRLLILYARYASEVPMSWKALLDDQVAAWLAALGPGGRWEGVPSMQALMRLAVLAEYRRTFSAAFELAPVRDAYLPEAMERIPAAGDSRGIDLIYNILCENLDAPADLADIRHLRAALAVRLERRSRFTERAHPSEIADARLLVRSICIEIDCREQKLNML